jgi:hypothetical protein
MLRVSEFLFCLDTAEARFLQFASDLIPGWDTVEDKNA